MAYIGRQLVRGQNRVLDDISGSFNGSTTAFNLTVSSSSSPPASVNQLWIILGGVLQKPGTDFTVADAVITFTTAPASTLSFWGMIQGDTSDINSPADASVTPSKIANSGDFAFPADVRFKDADGSHYVGLQAPSTVSSNLVWSLPAADGSANQLLKTDGSGNLGWATDSATDSTKMPLAGGSFTGDVIFTGDAANLTWDKSVDDLIFNDNAKAAFGTGSDMTLTHDGTNSTIYNSTGLLNLQNDGDDINLYAADDITLFVQGTEPAIKCIGNGGVELYYDNVLKLNTESAGTRIQGQLILPNTSGVSLSIKDGGKAVFGTNDDLQIYHDGSDSYVKHNGTGNFYIQTSEASVEDLFLQAGNDVYVRVQTGETAIKAIGDGGVELYHDNLKRIETTTSGIQVTGPDNDYASIDLFSDLGTHDGDKFRLHVDDGGPFYIRNKTSGSWENNIMCVGNGAVALYHDNVKTIETAANGYVNLTGSSDLRLTIGSQGTAGTNDANWIRGEGVNIMYNSASGNHTWEVGGSEKLRLQSGGGISFNGDNQAANALDDYEEGTFTPSYKAASANPTVGYQNQDGKYTKIGNVVYFQIYMRINSWSGGSGVVYLDSLPFTSTGTTYGGSGGILYVNAWGDDEPTNCMVGSSGTILYLYGGGLSSGTSQNLYSADVGTASQLRLNGTYIAA